MLGMLSHTDFSNGAKIWQGRDLNVKGSLAYREYYEKGLLFTNPSHDIFNMGSHKVNGSYKYETTSAFGATVFMKSH